ncbi:hypothetical protein ACEPAG_5301 [Sanghuangporus baumii]
MPEASTHPQRPQLLRGNTVPLYVRTGIPSSTTQNQQLQNDATSQPFSACPDKYATAGQRRQPPPTASSSRITQGWALPTPPLSTSPGSAESSNTDDAYFASVRQQCASASGGVCSTRSNGTNSSSSLSPVTSPTVTSLPASFHILRSARSPQSPSAPMQTETTPSAYILSAAIGPGFDSSCITIAMRKNNILDIVADRWDQENCHHEWQVQFDRDADMNGVHAGYTDGVLTVTVKRLYQSSGRPPQRP